MTNLGLRNSCPKSEKMWLKFNLECVSFAVSGICDNTPIISINVTIVSTIKMTCHDPSLSDQPPINGAIIVIIPLTPISAAKNLANALPWSLSPAEALAITMAPPPVKP